MNKVRASATEAVADIPDGASLAVGGFDSVAYPKPSSAPCTRTAPAV
jgi:Acyl CoA:acetate/3-ketoacid CoA transferase, alpha subunit